MPMRLLLGLGTVSGEHRPSRQDAKRAREGEADGTGKDGKPATELDGLLREGFLWNQNWSE